MSPPFHAPPAQSPGPIAIVGMACRFPGASGPQALWDLIARGADAVGPLSEARVAREGEREPGGYFDEVDAFDPTPFGLSPRECITLDPQHRLLLETAHQAFEAAGWTRAALRGSATGVFVGITNTDYARLLVRYGAVDHYFVTGNALNAAAGRLSYLFGLNGPAMAVDTACSSSLAAVHVACQSLRSGDCDAALAAGVNLILAPEASQGLGLAGVLSPDGRCRVFDAAAAGIGRGEGCGVLLLKRLEDAQRDGDRVLAVIRGSAINQDGASSGLTVPNGLAQEAVIRRALEQSGLSPHAIELVEAHGTGTSLGDPIEMAALCRVFAPDRDPQRPLWVGSIKANIAHGESAAGVAGLIKIVLSLQHEAIPPLAGFREPSPLIEWTDAVRVPRQLQPWPRGGRERVAGISGFGLSGTNVHLVVGEAPRPLGFDEANTSTSGPVAMPGLVVLPLSAGNESGLRRAAQASIDFLRTTDAVLVDVARTVFLRRDHGPHRLAVVAADAAQAAAALQVWVEDRPEASEGTGAAVIQGVAAPDGPQAPVFLFSGQGTQALSMGAELMRTEPVFREAMRACATVLGRDSLALLSDDAADTTHAQPALLAYQLALMAWWKSKGVTPAAVLGHSVGEFAAACAAGVMGLGDALVLVAERGRLMGALPRVGRMVSVLGTRQQVAEALAAVGAAGAPQGPVVLAAANAPLNQVVAGADAAVEAVVAHLQALGLKCIPLSVSHAFHSPLMEPVVASLRAVLSRMVLRPPRIPYFSSLLGRRVGQEVCHADYWLAQVLQPVEFEAGLRALHAEGFQVFLEVGTNRTLCGLARASLGAGEAAWIASQGGGLGEQQALYQALGQLYAAGAAVDWTHLLGCFIDPQRLPAYPLERRPFWLEPARPAAEAWAPVSGAVAASGPVYTVGWVAQALPERAAGSAPGARRWVLTRDGQGVAERLALALQQRGQAVRVVDLHAGVAAWKLGDATDLVHGAALDADDARPWDEGLQAGALSALTALQSVLRSAPQVRTWFLTRAAQSVDGGAVSVQQAGLWGLARVAALECPASWGGILDLDAQVDAQDLASELLSGGGGEVAWRGRQRWVPRLAAQAAGARAPFRMSPSRSYVLTGALGGLGSHTLQWLIACGARQVVLAGRRPLDEAAHAALQALSEASGARLAYEACDVARIDDAQRLLERARSMGPLGGFVHAAGAVDDALLTEQNPQRFETVIAGKVRGALNLDALTAGQPLDCFVLYSSLSAVLGSPGQANYAAANAMLDALAHRRRARGDVATSVNWGPWTGAGMAQGLQAMLRARGLDPWCPAAALDQLGPAVAGGAASAVLVRMEPEVLRQAFPLARLSMLDGLRVPDRPNEAAPGTRARTPGRPPVARPQDLEQTLAFLSAMMGHILRCPAGWSPAAGRSLQAQGIDSMMATEWRNRILRELEIDLPLSAFLAGSSLQSLAEVLLRQLTVAALTTTAGPADGQEILL
jgi:acyl transferase domain-containing protein